MTRRVLARLLLAALPLVPSGAARAAPFDVARVRTISVLDVVRLATGRYQILWVLYPAQKREALAQLDAMPEAVRILTWLVVLESKLVDPGAGEPPSILFDGQFKGRMAQALQDAALARKAQLFRSATDALPEPAVDDPRTDEIKSTLVPLGAGFGDKDSLDRDILALIATHPDAQRWCDEQRDALSDEDRLRALETGLVRSDGYGTVAGMNNWPVPYRTVALADIYAAEVDNGGVHQFFLNSSGDTAPEAAEAMAALGLPRQAAVIRSGMALFPAPYPSDRDRRSRSFDHPGWTDWDGRLDALTGDADDGTVEPALIDYAKREAILPK